MNIPGFTVAGREHGRTSYACEACPGRTTLNPLQHLQTQMHIINASLVNPFVEPLDHYHTGAGQTAAEPEVATLAFETIHISQDDGENSNDGEVIVPTRATLGHYTTSNGSVAVK
ncbi:hypothetical protein PGT21_020732 [Puccinia graminis f. sp. tritici]|uniref:Uncharacterized protein n=1 Tax=Puccinia graminis f. sp. tritici TaxID=56615 RepID=A0A5B0PDW4_PUCGR|nr:hypothetical protein PGTUg99_032216 [Puccinia graminis f. sp. tritici]KAA1099795.1 hypothetical protein PGT21_020732 [Puccinia graminis f. sp. tritici]